MEKRKHTTIYHYDIDNGKEEVEELIEIVDDELHYSEDSTLSGKFPVFDNPRKTWVPPIRKVEDPGTEVKNKMEEIGVNLSNAITEKKKRMESYIKGVVKDCRENIKQHLKFHQDEMREFKIDYTERSMSLFQQWDSDMKQLGDQEDKLTSTFYQQQKTLKQIRMLQNYNLKGLKQENEEFLKDLEDLDNGDLLTSVHSEIQKQMSLLQKKITDS